MGYCHPYGGEYSLSVRRPRQYGSGQIPGRRPVGHSALSSARARVEETSGSDDADICRVTYLPEAQWKFP
ncbi:hypothetical protein GCM10010398_00250 [Streptomyces fimbriatus]